MSRLYGRLKSDRRKTDATVGANHHLETHLTWGSASNPEKAFEALLIWNKDADYPILHLWISKDIHVELSCPGEPTFTHKPI